MSPLALSGIAGILCLPATYGLSREGNIYLALLVVALLGAVGGAIAQCKEGSTFRPWALSLAFVVGALLSEAVAFAHYYITYGDQDSKLSVGGGVAIVEVLVISVVGGAAMLAAVYVAHSRITCRSSRPPSAAPEL